MTKKAEDLFLKAENKKNAKRIVSDHKSRIFVSNTIKKNYSEDFSVTENYLYKTEKGLNKDWFVIFHVEKMNQNGCLIFD